MSNFFSVTRRNKGHWDIGDGDRRAFRIRGGEAGKSFAVTGEGEYEGAIGDGWLEFHSLSSAMSWIADYFMQEPPELS